MSRHATFGLVRAIWAAATITAASGVVVALRMYEMPHASKYGGEETMPG